MYIVYKVVHGCASFFIIVQGCISLYKFVHHCSMLYKVVHGRKGFIWGTWFYMVVQGYTWLCKVIYMFVQGCTQLYNTRLYIVLQDDTWLYNIIQYFILLYKSVNFTTVGLEEFHIMMVTYLYQRIVLLGMNR